MTCVTLGEFIVEVFSSTGRNQSRYNMSCMVTACTLLLFMELALQCHSDDHHPSTASWQIRAM